MPRARALPFTNRDEQRLARYSPEFIAAMRHDYEETDLSLAQMAAKHGVSERTVNRMRDRYGWARRSARVRDVAPAVRALQEATRLLVERQEFSLNRSTPAPNSAHSRASGNPEQNAPSSIAALGPRFRGDERERGDPIGPHRERTELTAMPPSPIERIERLVERELEAEETARKALGALPRPPGDAERCARTLATLTQTLHALARLRSGVSPDNGLADDDMPRDIDEFRRELARRIRVFVQNRIAGRVGGGVAAGADSAGEP